jgi:hypothetical protein
MNNNNMNNKNRLDIDIMMILGYSNNDDVNDVSMYIGI